MKKNTLLLFCLIASLTLSSKDMYFKHLGVSEGLSQLSVNTIYQDEFGAVWLGTSEGLNRYNGHQMTVFRPSQNNTGLTNNEINKLCGDRKGAMYIISGNDLTRFDLYKQKFSLLCQGEVYDMQYCNDTLWVLYKGAVYYYTEKERKLTFFCEIKQEEKKVYAVHLLVDADRLWVLAGDNLFVIRKNNPLKKELLGTFKHVRCLFKDSSENLWIGTWNGLYCISVDKSIRYFTKCVGGSEQGLSDVQVRCVLEDNARRLWIGTFLGLDCFDPLANKWTHYNHSGDSPNSLSHISVLSLYKDTQGNIWAGTYYGGANIFNPDENGSHFYHAEPLREGSLSYPIVGKMTEDGEGNLWICTEGGGLNRFNRATGHFYRYTHRDDAGNTIGSDNIKSIYYRKENNTLYLGTHLGGLSILDLNSNKIHTLKNKDRVNNSMLSDIVNEIQRYGDGLALLTQGGVVFFDPDTETFLTLSKDDKLQWLWRLRTPYETFYIDSRKRAWLALTSGGVVCVDLTTSQVERYLPDADNPSKIGKFKIDHIFEDKTGKLYFSTVGSGVFRFVEQSKSFKIYNTANKTLPSDYCYYICQSSNASEYLYFIHGKGFSIFNSDKEVVERTYRLFNQRYNQGSAIYVDDQKTVYVSGVNGLTSFQESCLYNTPVNTNLGFDKLYIYNHEVNPGDNTGILAEVLARITKIRLKYDQNNITVKFASFNYCFDRDMLFEYKLDNLDKDWLPISGYTLTYSNLPPGDYVLRVRQLDNNRSPLREIKLNIEVAAPFYATSLAYIIYFLLLICAMILIIRFKTRQAALKASLEYERKEKERIEELNQSKLRFFTNISHEFRTPLTLIIGQIEVLMQMDKLGTGVFNRILRVYRNAWHLRTLISELLDFRKQEQGYLKLRVEEKDIVTFTRQIYMCFYELAQKKNISYKFDFVEDIILVWFDPVQMQKVIFNLLSNAFKYTPDKGHITVMVNRRGYEAVVEVSDTGVGISEGDIDKIFERFYQTGDTAYFSRGSGIGLALAKGVVDAHHGSIEVNSSLGNGSVFTLILQLGNRHFREDELNRSAVDNDIMPDTLPEESTDFDELELDRLATVDSSDDVELVGNAERPIILLVEDNKDLLLLLKETFEQMYEVYLAHNGREGLELARQLQPDLILSDVMMPEMSGKEMCYRIKNNVELSHISVILLTAQTSIDHVTEGYMFGADDYITKPFNMKILLARCNNVIRNKQRLIVHYAGRPMQEATADTAAVSEHDKELINKCIDIVKQNFCNPNFDVTMLASELFMGRSKLYLLFKQIIGLTPNEFILKVKLDEAMSLLRNNPEYNISEISFQLGFSSPRYFSKCFKSFFGVSPQKIRRKDSENSVAE